MFQRKVLLFLLVLFVLGCSKVSDTKGSGLALRGMPGPEDIVSDNFMGKQRLLVSSDPRWNPEKEGAIFAVWVLSKQIQKLKRIGGRNQDFHPHGISLVSGEDGTNRLYIVLHHRKDSKSWHSIAVYRVERDTLIFEKDLQSPLLTSPNDLCANPDGSFYVANDRSGNGIFELLLGLPKCTVVFYNGKSWSVVARGFAMANSIAIDGETLYVSETRGNRIDAFHIESDGSLTQRRVFAKIKGADNLTLQDGFLTVAAHENLLAFMDYASHPKHFSPSAIYRINLTDGIPHLLFRDKGLRISAASVGVVDQNTLWIGQVFDNFIYAFDLKTKQTESK